MSEQRCETCHWWTYKECRRYPPQVAAWQHQPGVGRRTTMEWPETMPGDFCGEWRAKEHAE